MMNPEPRGRRRDPMSELLLRSSLGASLDSNALYAPKVTARVAATSRLADECAAWVLPCRLTADAGSALW